MLKGSSIQRIRRNRALSIISIAVIVFGLVTSTGITINAAEIYDEDAFSQEEMQNVLESESLDSPNTGCMGTAVTEESIMQSEELASGPVLVSIQEQPQDVTVAYPNSCEFTVAVDSPTDVKAYQWYLRKGSSVFKLDGASATESTLKWTSTTQRSGGAKLFCKITDNNNNVIKSEEADLNISNEQEDITVLYVMNYALEAGDTLDISKCINSDGEALGEGIVEFDENGRDISFSNLDIDNEYVESDRCLISGPGVVLDRYMNDRDEYRIHLEGENKIVNRYYDPAINAAGITFDLLCYGEDITGTKRVDPLITIDGEGSLDLTGGTYAFRKFMGDLVIKSDIETHIYRDPQYGTVYSRGIVSEYNTMSIEPGVELNLATSASAIQADDKLEIKDADINIVTEAARVSEGATTYSGISSGEGMKLEDSRIDIDFNGSKDIFSMQEDRPLTSVNGIACRSSDPKVMVQNTINNCDIDISIKTDYPEDEDYYANSFAGIYSASLCNTEISSSDIDIEINSGALNNARGIQSVAEKDNSLTIKDGSCIDIDVDTHYGSYGIFGTIVNIENSSIDSDVASEYNIYDYRPIGIFAKTSLNIDLSEKDKLISSYAEDGTAIACSLNDSKVEIKYDPAYKATKINLSDSTVVATPSKHSVSSISFAEKKNYGVIEAVFDSEDTTAPADTVRLTSNYTAPATGDSSNLYLYVILTVLSVGAIIAIVILKRRK